MSCWHISAAYAPSSKCSARLKRNVWNANAQAQGACGVSTMPPCSSAIISPGWYCRVSLNTASKGKYAQVLGQIGGYAWLQRLLAVLHSIAESHGVSIADVATRWVLDKPAVGAVIVGAAPTFLHCTRCGCWELLRYMQLNRSDRQLCLYICRRAQCKSCHGSSAVVHNRAQRAG